MSWVAELWRRPAEILAVMSKVESLQSAYEPDHAVETAVPLASRRAAVITAMVWAAGNNVVDRGRVVWSDEALPISVAEEA